MSPLQAAVQALGQWPAPVLDDNRVRVATHCLYPSNSAVNVYVEGGSERFIVHDDGGAVQELGAVGGHSKNAARLIGHLLRPMGLRASEAGVIYSPQVSLDGLAGGIVLVANTSKEAAEFLLHQHKPPKRNLNALVERILDIEFPSRWLRQGLVVGASNKGHRFDYVVRLRNDRQLLLDLVVPEASSINSSIVSHLDVRNASNPKYEQRIVYDDAASWRASDLALLRVGARPVPFSHLNETLDRLAA